jgi:antitoxin (DNA-binding transcriptional repressor) of toxin-antitoxin stability system
MDHTPSPIPTIVVAEYAEPRLSELLDRVEQGEEIVITRNGRAVARLTPGGGHDIARALAAVERLAALRKELAGRGINVTQDEIRAMRDEGRP